MAKLVKMASAAIESAKIIAMTALIMGKANANNADAQAAMIDLVSENGEQTITANGDPLSDYTWNDLRLEYTYHTDGERA